jgi:hypothetical protein
LGIKPWRPLYASDCGVQNIRLRQSGVGQD